MSSKKSNRRHVSLGLKNKRQSLTYPGKSVRNVKRINSVIVTLSFSNLDIWEDRHMNYKSLTRVCSESQHVAI